MAGVDIPSGADIIGAPVVERCRDSEIVLGQRVALCSWESWTALGVSHAVILRTMRPGAYLRIGNDTGISGASICVAESVIIGDRCLIGADVIITDTDFHPLEPTGRRFSSDWEQIGSRPVLIGDDVFVGARSVILKGVQIGDGSVIGAGSVVVTSVPPGVVTAGNPARIIRAI